ncbi:MAG: tetratricopeptide repeat protein [Chromatiales bacterium]|jgi:predicted negative regulator of RcsB-dependent stress response
MKVYQTEEEQVEAIKKWWKENGTSVVAGLVIGLGAVFGWQAWNSYQDRMGREASVAFYQMLNAVDRTNNELANKQAELLRTDYPSTSYAVLAAMTQARLKVEAGDMAAASAQLDWAMQNAGDESLKTLARLNLARIKLNDGDLEAASELAKVEEGGFAGDFAELRGDIAVAKQELSAARDAYAQALALNVGNPELVQMKLDDIAIATP